MGRRGRDSGSGVMSNAHDNTSATGNPSSETIMAKVVVQPGSPTTGNTSVASWMTTTATAAYTAATRTTRRRLSSPQNESARTTAGTAGIGVSSAPGCVPECATCDCGGGGGSSAPSRI